MTAFDELKQIKEQCLADITEALPNYVKDDPLGEYFDGIR
jgi:hypothetical protein